ncbi:MAG: S41 family peptidase, partial [Rikenellaceae bacterium]
QDLIRRIEHEELFTADSIAFADSLRFVTPKGRVVYGGGGIMPDIFVPMSKEKLPKFFVEVVGRNVLYLYTIDYSDRHRDELAKIETLADLDALFAGDSRLVDNFITYAKSKGIEGSAEEIAASRELLERQLKGYIGRNTTLSDNGFYANVYPLDDVLMRAIETLSE